MHYCTILSTRPCARVGGGSSEKGGPGFLRPRALTARVPPRRAKTVAAGVSHKRISTPEYDSSKENDLSPSTEGFSGKSRDSILPCWLHALQVCGPPIGRCRRRYSTADPTKRLLSDSRRRHE